MKISEEFSKNSAYYGSYNIIQKKVVKKLLSFLHTQPKNILDLGCGNGEVCKSIEWDYEHFTGVDFAPGMLELHPKSKNIECIYGDFNDATLFENILTNHYDYILSSSAMQWAKNLEELFCRIKYLEAPVALAIFTSGTFDTLNKTANIDSLLQSKECINELQKKCFDVNFEVIKYKLEFSSVRDIFRYIKRSGVSGSRNILSYKDMKRLMEEYPLNYLEFEVAFIYS